MNIALLTISSLSLVTSAATLAILAKTVHELHQAKKEIEDFKSKTNRNLDRVKVTLGQMEL